MSNPMSQIDAAPSSIDGTPDEKQISRWMQNYIASALKISSADVNINHRFEQIGLDSLAIVGMTGDLATWLGFDLDPAVAYEHNSIGLLARAIAKENAR
jgi:acyl carrier protein